MLNHSAKDFQVQVGDQIAQLILKKIKTPTIQKVIVLSATGSGIGGFANMGLQSNDPSTSVIQKDNWAEKSKRYKKREMLEGSKEKITPSSHIVSRQAEAEPSFEETSGIL